MKVFQMCVRSALYKVGQPRPLPLSMLAQVPKYLSLVSLLVAMFLMAFLFLGSSYPDKAYRNVYLAQFRYNTTLPLFQAAKPVAHAETVVVSANYLAMCVSVENRTTCSTLRDVSQLHAVSTLRIGNLLVSLALMLQAFVDVSHVGWLATSVCVVAAGVVLSLVSMVPCLPYAVYVNVAKFILSLAAALWWLAGLFIQLQMVSTATRLVPLALLALVQAKRGRRAEAMAWSAFALLVLALAAQAAGLWRERRREGNKCKA